MFDWKKDRILKFSFRDNFSLNIVSSVIIGIKAFFIFETNGCTTFSGKPCIQGVLTPSLYQTILLIFSPFYLFALDFERKVISIAL
jgi:hypothetical protein